MFKNYLKITFRNILRNKTYSFLNIFGLAVGIASFIVILVYVNYELSYDKWDSSLEKVYKLSLRQNQDFLSTTQAPLAALLKQNYPNVEAATAIMPSGDFEVLLSVGEKAIYQKGVVTVDSSFLKVFPYKLLKGNVATALNTPNAVILSNEVSHKLFGDANPMGKPIKIYNAIDGVVTGIMRKSEGPSHLDAQMLMRDPYGKQNNFWQNYSFQTYIKLKHPVAEPELENGINRIYYDSQLKKNGLSYEEYKKSSNQTALFSDAVQDLHNFPKHGENHFTITIILLILAVFLLIAGAINFSNLSLAMAITKAKEVGIRKVLGSTRIHIIIQSLLDITFQCCLSLLLAILFVNIALPYFSKSFDLPLSFFNHQSAISISVQIAVSLFLIILISGLYPALFLSHFKTAQVLKGNYTKGTKGVSFRNSLLVVQLTLSAFFIIGMIVINRQLDFMQTKDLGFNPSQVIRIEATQKSREEGFPVVRTALLSVPGVEYVAKSTDVPGSKVVDTSSLEFKCAGKKVRLNSGRVSIDYFKTMNIQLLRGRLFENDRAEDLDNTAIINETAMKKMGIAEPVGQIIYFPYCDSVPYTIVGIVKDFNVQGLQYQVNPTIYTTSNAHCGYKSGGAILVKIKTDHAQQALAGIETVWKKIEPAFPIRYSFLDQDFQNLLAEYIRVGKIISFFTIISIVIAAIGLFALTSFLAQQRVKEIGVRKVLGASVSAITVLLSKDFIRLVIIAIFIATPISWWALQKWLEDFAFRINLNWWMFVLAGVITISITLIVVCFGAIKAAIANPVKNLRTE
jgi:putative ABC transport system permease protein